jgi:hypothetical protein
MLLFIVRDVLDPVDIIAITANEALKVIEK